MKLNCNRIPAAEKAAKSEFSFLVFDSFFSLPAPIQEVGYCEDQSHPGYNAEQERTHFGDGMNLAQDEEQCRITEDDTDADAQPEPLEIMVKNAFVCECDGSVETDDKKDGHKVPELAGVLL